MDFSPSPLNEEICLAEEELKLSPSDFSKLNKMQHKSVQNNSGGGSSLASNGAAGAHDTSSNEQAKSLSLRSSSFYEDWEVRRPASMASKLIIRSEMKDKLLQQMQMFGPVQIDISQRQKNEDEEEEDEDEDEYYEDEMIEEEEEMDGEGSCS